MMYGNYHGEEKEVARDYDKNFNCIKYMIYTINVVLLLATMTMVGGAIYILIEKTYISDVLQNQLLTAGVWLVILAGALIIFSIPICGCVGTAKEKKSLLGVYTGFLILLFLMFLSGGICTIVLRGEIGEWILDAMERTIRDDYGVNLDNPRNRFITQQWDRAQIDMNCCGVRDQSWGIYRRSSWYDEQQALYGDPSSGNRGKVLVPTSCCVLLRDNVPVNQQKCQLYQEGPPFKQGGSPGSNTYNNALYYRGCYEAGKYWMRYFGAWIIGFGIGFAGAVILGIVFTVLLILRLRK